MLLTLFNLPYMVKYSDIKALILAKCGIEEIILDNLLTHDNHSKKVTIGLATEEDAAIVMRNLNGFFMDGHQLRIAPKSKFQQPSNPNGPPQQIPIWTPPKYVRPPVPQMVPPPLMNDVNVNQTAYYLLNQPSYPSQPTTATSNTPQHYSNPNYNVNRQGSWLEKHVQVQNTPRNMNPDSAWNNSRDPRVNIDRSPHWGPNRAKEWCNNRNRDMDNSRDSQGFKRESEWESNRGSRREDGREWNWGNGRDSNRNDNRDSRWDSNRDSVREKNRDFNRNSHRPNQSPASHSNRDSSYNRHDRENTWLTNQNVYASHGKDTRDSKRNVRDDKSRPSSRKRSPDRRNIDRTYSPHPKRPHLANIKHEANDKKIINTVKSEPSVPRVRPKTRGKRPVTRTQTQDLRITDKNKRSILHQWRSQLAGFYAKSILQDKAFVYEVPNFPALQIDLKRAIQARMEYCFKDVYIVARKQMEELYERKYSYISHWGILRKCLNKLGGKLISPTQQPVIPKKHPPTKKVKPQVAPKYGTVYGNLKVDHRFGRTDPAQGQQQGHDNMQGGYINQQPSAQQHQGVPGNSNIANNNKPKSQKKKKGVSQPPGSNKPLAKIPGRIPHYPQGEKKTFNQLKRRDNALYTAEDNASSAIQQLKPAVRTALEQELNGFTQLIEDEVNNADPDDAPFCKHLLSIVPQPLNKMITINLARRMIPLLPLPVRISGNPLVKRLPLENYLKAYKVSSLNRAKKSAYYTAYCDSVEDHDKLCSMKHVVDGLQVLIKPLNMIGKNKLVPPREQILEQRSHTKNEYLKHSMMVLGLTDEDMGEPETMTTEEKNLRQEINELYDKIKTKIEKNGDIEEFEDDKAETATSEIIETVKDEYVSPLKSGVSVNDLTSEANLAQIMDNLKEEVCLPIIEDRVGDGTKGVTNGGETVGDEVETVGEVVETVRDRAETVRDGVETVADEEETVGDEDQVSDHDRSVIENVVEIETVNLVDDNDDDVEEVYEEQAGIDAIDDIDLADVNDDDLEDW